MDNVYVKNRDLLIRSNTIRYYKFFQRKKFANIPNSRRDRASRSRYSIASERHRTPLSILFRFLEEGGAISSSQKSNEVRKT